MSSGMRLSGFVCVLLGLLLAVMLLPAPAGAKPLWEDDLGAASTPSAEDWVAIARWIDEDLLPIPSAPPEPLSQLRARGASGWSSFREPFPPVPVWNPAGPKKVGIQAGHWLFDEAPDELEDLRTNPGASGGGMAEWEVNLEIANRTAEILRQAGVEADVLPTSVPVRYRAHAFVTIHADGDLSGALTGYKVARPLFSGTPAADDRLVESLNDAYGDATNLSRRDEQISRRMTGYYAFNARRYQHAVAPGVPQAIIEAGFMTSASDRRLLIGDPERAARGIAAGILDFLRQESGDGGTST